MLLKCIFALYSVVFCMNLCAPSIQVHLKKIEYGDKVFSLLISKSETFIYFRFITCKVKHFKSCFVLILMIRAYS